jgi:putative ABC transport system permease protein
MTRVVLKGLGQRRFRTALTAFAIVLGVAMVSGAFTLTDTMRKAADSLSSSAYDGADAAVSARTAFEVDADSGGRAPTIAASTLDSVRRTPGVAAVAGDITDTAKIIGRDGKPLGSGPYFGVGLDVATRGAERLNPFRLQSGRWASGPGEVVVDLGTAREQELAVGDPVRVATRGPARSFRVVGVTRFGDVKSLGTATVALFDLHTAQTLFHKQGRLDAVLAAAEPGTSGAALRRDLASALPANMKVQTAAAQDRFTLDGLDEFLTIIKAFLLVFGGIAVFVGAFTIYNTLSITVAQRSRELAMLRTVGASRRQVLGSVLLEALAIGALGSLVGIVAGLGLAHGLNAVLTGFGLELPQASTGLAGRTILISALVGIVVTVLAGLGPALRATRVAPVLALREGLHIPPGRVGRRSGAIGTGLAALGLGIVAYGMFGGGLSATDRLISLAPGCLALFLGIALLSPKIARPLASVLGRPGAKIAGVAGGLARRNAMRNPRRTAVTAAALMVGVALVTFVAVLGAGLKASSTGEVEDSLRAGFVASGQDGYSPIDPDVARTAAGVPGVTTATSLRQDRARAFGKTTTVDGVEPGKWARVWSYDYDAGSPATLAGLRSGDALVRKEYAKKHHLAVGDRFTLTTASGRHVALTVRGKVDVSSLNPVGLGDVTMARSGFDRAFPVSTDRFALVTGGSSAALERALEGFPDANVTTADRFQKDMGAGISQLLALVYVLLGLAVIVSLFGIVNTLALAVLERTREIGMLRAVGMTRRQVRRMIRHEGIVTALIGAALGIVVGLGLGAIVTGSLAKYGLVFALPLGLLLAFVAIAVLAGRLAAVLPARRAARMNPLTALSYE